MISERWIDDSGTNLRIGDTTYRIIGAHRADSGVVLTTNVVGTPSLKGIKLISKSEVEILDVIPDGQPIPEEALESVVGALPNRTLIDQSEVAELLPSLNNQITMAGKKPAAGTSLKITNRHQIRGQVKLAISNGNAERKLSLVWFGAVGDSNYCILLPPPEESTEELGLGGDKLIFRMKDKDHLVVLSDSELQNIGPEIARAFLSRGSVFASDVEAVLGSVPTA